MKNNKAIHILKTLSTWERRSLEEFLHSPAFNKKNEILSLWEILQKEAPDYEGEVLHRENIFPIIWPDKSYQERKLRHLFSDLTGLIESWLCWKALQEDDILQHRLLSQIYETRHLPKYQQEKLRRREQALEKEADQHAEYYTHALQLEEDRYFSTQDKRKDAYPVDQVLLALDRMYLTKKLKYSSERINRANIFQEEYRLFLTNEMLKVLPEFPELHGPMSRLYEKIYRMLTDDEAGEQHYHQLKELLTGEQLVNSDELSFIYFFAINFCIKQLNLGKHPFQQEAFEMYREAADRGLLFDDGNLSEDHYKNLVTLGTRQGEYEWTRSFIEEYKVWLPEEEAENAFTYNLAYLSFAEKKYALVKRLLRKVEFANVFYQLGAKTILIRTYYEEEEWESLMYLLNSFQRYLRRNKALSNYQQSLYLNLVKMVSRMVYYHWGERYELKDLRSFKDAHPDMAAGSWIESKLKAL